MRKRSVLVIVMMASIAALRPIASAPPPADATNQNGSAPTLVGAWSIDVTPAHVPPFLSLGTFSADGTLTNISTPSLGFPPESPGYGEWAKIGGHTYAITFHTLYGDGAGNFGGRGKVRATVTVGPTGDDVSGVFQVDIFDAAGVLAASDTGTVKGTRLRVEALP